MWDAIKGNWAQVVVASGMLLGVGAGYMEWRINVAVTNKFKDENIVSASEVDANKTAIVNLEKNVDKIDNKIERVVQILLEE